MNRRSLLLGLAGGAVVAAAGGGYAVLRQAPAETLIATPAEAAPGGAVLPDIALGRADAPVTLIEYASYTCSHCARFHETVFPSLKRDYIDTGKLRFILREVYFDKFGLWAGQVAQCGGDLKYYGIAGMLFTEQAAWIGDGAEATIAENLRKIGLKAGLTKAQVETCLNDTARAEAMVRTYQKNASADAIEGTPTLVINGEKHDNMGYAELKKILDAKLGG